LAMALRLLAAIATAGLIVARTPAAAGPCAPDIESVQAVVDARIEKTVSAERFAREARRAFGLLTATDDASTAARDGPPWIGAALAGLARARAADATGDDSACGQALADVRRLLDR
jgi:hypothetical protein